MSDRKKKSGGLGPFILVVVAALLIAGAAGMFYASQKSKPKDLSTADKNEAFDLMEESKSAHHTLDEILMKHKDTWQLQDTDRKEKAEKMPSTGVEVHYTQREVDIGVPPTTELKGAAAWLKEQLQGSKVLHVLDERKAKYNGYEAYRMDLGIRVKAGKTETKTFVTDTVYFSITAT